MKNDWRKMHSKISDRIMATFVFSSYFVSSKSSIMNTLSPCG